MDTQQQDITGQKGHQKQEESYALPSNNNIDIYNDLSESDLDEDDENDIGLAINMNKKMFNSNKYWLLPFQIYM